MLNIEAEKREPGMKRKQGFVPAVLYGPEVKNISLEINAKEFEKLYNEAGESSLINVVVSGKEYPVLIYGTDLDPLTNSFIHVDFYQPILTEEVEASVEIIFEGESPAVKELGGTLVKEIQEIEVKALPQNLPHEIKVDISNLKTFEDEILVKDLALPANVSVSKNPEDIVAMVAAPEKVEEELEKPIEEDVEKVESAEKKEEVSEEEKQEGEK
ncbi:MAG: hypothetical protein A2365_03470 [Candidatus Nealsonbacteria bacterium RIFOXYB1_FULL_40_15]|uniref:Large ribosomal subunit protein bL25 n=2 Tax=Candidatus Nealsoniibacteriota TaxID=1817911 RepID=A0A1G2ERD2_9BACT|nr:MAG: hypothetical protein A2365_03470 [Candidatus Nealsonbacteria bacterium RIFOXYB1_FULL_40_15]OGZ28364.1 MAG: hypothetical protein A2427_01150 [Candidatus Nealsonbacteria bacterium RIFOXYC1_FULL_40_7]OGZ29489.1 MAG: hypothetical protein A2562_02245 [Candidatus Nealsonbacteria bacterium RIFOXYD1_FULL_39_11]